jgi:3-methylcrotonyl-CoA carboxylase alpha subunit
MFSTLLIANRGEIACRIMRTAKRMGLRTIAVYSDADAGASHVQLADTAVRLGPAPAKESYLLGDAIIAAAKATGADAIHPGYGFLSENAAFSEAVEKAGLIFVGPPASAIRAMGLKDAAKALMMKAGVPVVPGYLGQDQTLKTLAAEAGRVGYPVMIKAVAGGGGKGMRKVEGPADFAKALEGAQREAQSAFGDARVLIEKYVLRPRHIEVQVFADAHGNALHLFERDCSVQRRHQKVIEEAPAPGMTPELRKAMGEAAVKAALAIGYRGAGTVEFIADTSKGLRLDSFFFMEMNTRLQVEHPVTEMITGFDLVEWQLRVAAGEKLPLRQDEIHLRGHAIEVRLYAEDPAKGFLPSTGALRRLRLPNGDANVRVDSGVVEGDRVSMFYDPMIAKIIAWDDDRTGAARRLALVLQRTEVAGVKTNLGFLIDLLSHPAFLAGDVDTGFIERHQDTLFVPAAKAPEHARVLAVLAHILSRGLAQRTNARSWPSDPWNAVDGFRLGARQDETVQFEDGATIRLRPIPDGFEISGGEKIHLAAGSMDDDGKILATIDGVRCCATGLILGHEIVVLLDGRVYSFTLHDPLDAEHDALDHALTLVAPMPGKVIQVLVAPGANVRKGQAVAILEAMKMEHTLTAPADLVVESLAFGAGDQVQEGAVVATFKAA